MIAENSPDVPQESSNRRVAKNASIYFISQLLTWIVTFISVSIIPKYQGADIVGKLTYVGTLAGTMVGVLMFGIDSYLAKEIGRDRSQTERLICATLGLRIALSIPACLGAFIFLCVVRPDPLLWKLGLLGIVGMPLLLIFSPLRAALVGREQAQRVSLLDVLGATTPLCLIPFLPFNRPENTAVIASLITVLSFLLTTTLAVLWLRRSMRVAPLVDFPLWGRLLRGGLPFLLNNLILTVYGVVSVLQLKFFADFAAIGVYSQAQRLFGTFLFVPTALGTALLPSLSRLAGSSPAEFQRVQGRVLSLLIILGLPMMAGVFLLARPLSLLLYGPTKFVDMPQVLQLYALVIIPMYVVSTMYQFLVAQNRNALWTGFLASTVGIYALSSVFLIPFCRVHFHSGAMGAVGATLIAETCSMIFSLILLKANPFSAETLGRIVRAIVATAGMSLAVLAVLAVFRLTPAALQNTAPILLLMLIISSLVGGLVFAGLCWALHVLTEDEQQRVVGFVRRKLGR